MANDYSGNPIVLDTFSSAIDLGNILFGNSNAMFFIEHIEWQNPNAVNDTAIIYDGSGTREIFSETCTTAKQSILKKFGDTAIAGLKINTSGVASGKISILLATNW
jgi:hypothetical protein